MVIFPTIVKIPTEWNIVRNTVQPKENYPQNSFGLEFDDTYDYETLFSGVIRLDKNTVVFISPPFLNLKNFLQNEVEITANGSKLVMEFYDLDRCSIALVKVSETVREIQFSYNNKKLTIAIENNLATLNKNKKILFSMIKNDPKHWIKNWINYHNRVYGVDSFVIFNNNSDEYTSEELEIYLISESYSVSIVDWPMRWGVNGPPWDSDFCKIVALQYLKYKFAYDAECVLNLDIDEYFVSEYSLSEIIESMKSQNKDTINIESKNISRYKTSTNLNSSYWYHPLDVDVNKMVKWITLPEFSRNYPWTTHYVFSPNFQETDEFYYAHLSALTGDHHIKNSTIVSEQRMIIRKEGYKKDEILKRNFESLEMLSI